MLKCDVHFSQKVHQISNGASNSQQGSNSPIIFKPYYLSLEDYKLIFFANKNDERCFYETSAGEIVSNLDITSRSLTLTRKGADLPLLKIRSDVSSLEKIAKYCEAFKNESMLYNPLVYVPSKQPVESDGETNKSNDVVGYATLGAIVILSTKFKDVLSNFMSHGLLDIDIDMFPHPMIIAYSLGWIIIASLIMIFTEKLAFKKIISSKTVAVIESINLLVAFVFPADYCHRYKPGTLLALFYVSWSLMMIMKMTSYMHFMYELRQILPKILKSSQENGKHTYEPIDLYISKENLKIVQKYKKDISEIVNVGDILYFYFVPTLVYQLWFPRSPQIRWGVVIKLSTILAICCAFQVIWLNQLFIPTMREAGRTFKVGTFLQKLEKVFEFANCFAVLMPIMTYSLFNTYLNLLSEILRFDDRDFYKDWWNSQRIRLFWNRWNRPVHKWCQRHVYFPLLKRGHSKVFGLTAVFLFSGIMHEYLFSIPSRVYVLYSLGLLTQVPIIILEKKYEKFCERHSRENFFIWACLGYTLAPFAIIQYYVAHMDSNEQMVQ